jgi:hypothetical protein
MKSPFKTVFASILCTAGFLYGAAYPQTEKPKSYELTETQRLRLELQQTKFAVATEHYQQAAAAFNAEVKAVEKEHGWPETTQFDPNTLTFREPPEPPKSPDSKPAPATDAPKANPASPPAKKP